MKIGAVKFSVALKNIIKIGNHMIEEEKAKDKAKGNIHMNNRHLKIFITVYKYMNMTLAAESLYISQPSVSQSIKELETYYGAKLFERYPKKLYATPEGDLLYAYATQIFGLYDKVKEEIQFMTDNVTIKVGANISAGTVLIRDYIDKLHEIYPNVKIEVKVTGSAKLKQKLMGHEIDFALMEDLICDTNLIQEPFYRDRIVFVCAPENPLAEEKDLKFDQLVGNDFLLREKGVGVRDKFEYLMMLNDINIEPLWESGNTRSLVNAAHDNYGIAVLPYLLVKEDINSGYIAELDVREDALNRNLNIVYHRDKIFNKWAQAFINIIKESGNI